MGCLLCENEQKLFENDEDDGEKGNESKFIMTHSKMSSIIEIIVCEKCIKYKLFIPY